MATQVFHLEIPDDRTDLIDLAKFISKKVADFTKSNQKTNQAKGGLDKILSFAGSQKGAFDNMSVKDIRVNKALKL